MRRGQPLSPVLSVVAQTGLFVTREMEFFSYYGNWYATATPNFSPLALNAVHHSASDDRSWRNLLRLATNFQKHSLN